MAASIVIKCIPDPLAQEFSIIESAVQMKLYSKTFEIILSDFDTQKTQRKVAHKNILGRNKMSINHKMQR